MLLPLDRRRRLRTDVQGYSVHRRDLVDDPARDRLEQVVGQARPVSRHRVLRRHRPDHDRVRVRPLVALDRKSTRLNSSHITISYAVFCLKKKKKTTTHNLLEKKKQK